MSDPKLVLDFAKRNDVKILDLRFTDLPGLWHHISYPIEQLTEASFEEGFGMDGSSIRGWAAIHESDMLLIPDPHSYLLDPFTEVSTLVMIADVIDPVTKQRYDRDPRYIARKAELYLSSSGMRLPGFGLRRGGILCPQTTDQQNGKKNRGQVALDFTSHSEVILPNSREILAPASLPLATRTWPGRR